MNSDACAARAVSVLIVSWRTREVTLRAIAAALEATDHIDAEIVVIDNASGDGTAEAVRERWGTHSDVRLVANADNRGFAGGNNQALAASTGEMIVVCNPDLELRREALDRLLALAAHSDVGIATGCLIGLDGRPQTLHRRLPDLRTVAMTLTRPGAWIDHRLLNRLHQRRYRMTDLPRLGVADIGQAAGALLVMRRSVITGVLRGALFDEDLPILINDVDLSRRVHDAGLRIVVDWDSWMVHEGAVSLRQLDERAMRALRWAGLRRYYAVHDPPWQHKALRVLRVTALAPSRSGVSTASPATAGSSADSHDPSDDAPLVSIVIPAYNYGHYVAEAVDSALAQTYPHVEVLVIDDGSTDETPEVLGRYRERISVHRQANAGLSAARNVGARLASGEFLLYLDADDRLHPEFVQRCLAVLVDHPAAGFAYPQVHHFGAVEHVTSLAPYDLSVLRDRNEISACCLLRRHLVLAHPYDERNRIGWEDWDLFLTLAENGWGGVLVDDALLDYRRHDESMTSSIASLRRRRLHLAVLRRHPQLIGVRPIASQWWRVQRMRFGLARRRWAPQRAASRTP